MIALVSHAAAVRVAGGLAIGITGQALEDTDSASARRIATLSPSGSTAVAPALPTGPPAPPAVASPAPIPAVPVVTTGETWSTQIHAGPGSEPLKTVAARLAQTGADLSSLADETERCGGSVDANWQDGMQRAGANITAHAQWLRSTAQYANSLAAAADNSALAVETAISSTDTPETFRNLHHQVQEGYKQFQASGGVISAPYTSAKTNLSTAQSKALEAQIVYAAAANTTSTTAPRPPRPAPPIVNPNPGTETSGAPADDQPHSDKDERDRTPGGDGGNDDDQARSPQGGDPNNHDDEPPAMDDGPGAPMAGGGGEPPPPGQGQPPPPETATSNAAGGAFGTILGSILGTGSQLAGSLPGMSQGGGGSPMAAMPGLPSIPGLGAPAMPSPELPSDFGSEDTGFEDEFGPTNTDPAASSGGGGGGGSPALPPSSSAAPATANTVPPAGPPVGAPTNGGGAPTRGMGAGGMGMFPPPMMGGMGGQQSPERDKNLFPDRRVVHRPVPNGEPVFGELERERKRRPRKAASTQQEDNQ